MASHVALLLAVNLGAGNRISMPLLRQVVEDLGHTEVATYLQSGNVVLRASGSPAAAALAGQLHRAIADRTGLEVGVVVLTARQWRDLVGHNPFPQEQDPTKVHVLVRQDPVPVAHRRAAEAMRDRMREQGSGDDLAVSGRAVYLHLPNGLGRSELYTRLARSPAAGSKQGTARNWRTVLALDERLG